MNSELQIEKRPVIIIMIIIIIPTVGVIVSFRQLVRHSSDINRGGGACAKTRITSTAAAIVSGDTATAFPVLEQAESFHGRESQNNKRVKAGSFGEKRG
uniref:Uncharacterized protein n=1 Tax=Rhizophora mucronata TaxID=61149 RepID=A0A2P2PK25_RHIMU